ncbi:class III lanthipeptide [Lactiplantibacillus plantarum]
MNKKILSLQKLETRSRIGKKNSFISIACVDGSTVSLFACPGNPIKP